MNKRTFLQRLGAFFGSLPLTKRLMAAPAPVKTLSDARKVVSKCSAISPLDQFFASEAPRIKRMIFAKTVQNGCVSVLVKKAPFPSGSAKNFIFEPSGAPRKEATVIASLPPPIFKSYSCKQALLNSEKICLLDASRSQNFGNYLDNTIKNFVNCSVEEWEHEDTRNYMEICGRKIVAGRRHQKEDNFANDAPDQIDLGLLSDIYSFQLENGAFEDCFLKNAKDAPLMLLLASHEQIKDLTKRLKSYIEPIYSEPSGEHKHWLIDRLVRVGEDQKSAILSVAGFVFIAKVMPRHDLVDGKWVQRHFWTNGKSEINPEYVECPTEDIILWNPQVMTRLCPDGDEDGVGDVRWLNVPNGDPKSPDFNPLRNTGNYSNLAMAAWRPGITQFGAVIRVARPVKHNTTIA